MYLASGRAFDSWDSVRERLAPLGPWALRREGRGHQLLTSWVLQTLCLQSSRLGTAKCLMTFFCTSNFRLRS